MQLIQDDNRVYIAAMKASTLAAKIAHWHSRIHGAWLISAAGWEVHLVKDEHNALRKAQVAKDNLCRLLLEHSEI